MITKNNTQLNTFNTPISAAAGIDFNANMPLRAMNTNLFAGLSAGDKLTANSTFHNTFVGLRAGQSLNTGSSNVFIGLSAGSSITKGCSNLMIGNNAGSDLYKSCSNTFLGNCAGQGKFSVYNTSADPLCVNSIVYMGDNIAIGGCAGRFICHCVEQTTRYNCGYPYTYFRECAAGRNIFMGHKAGQCPGPYSRYNIAIGDCAQSGCVHTSMSNVFIGKNSGKFNSTGGANIAIGQRTMYCNTTGTSNVAIGNYAGFNITSGSGNVFLGNNAGLVTTAGTHNIGIGGSAMSSLARGQYNIAIGSNAGRRGCCTAACNIFIGTNAAAGGFNYNANIQSKNNVFIGSGAGKCASDGNYNNFIGFCVGARASSSGCFNNFIGERSGYDNNGSFNNFLGYRAGNRNTSGNNNTFIGRSAGCTNTTGANNIIIGNGADMTINSLSGVIVMGAGALASASNTLVLGSTTTRLSAVPATTLTNQVSSLIVILNGTSLRIPILSGP